MAKVNKSHLQASTEMEQESVIVNSTNAALIGIEEMAKVNKSHLQASTEMEPESVIVDSTNAALVSSNKTKPAPKKQMLKIKLGRRNPNTKVMNPTKPTPPTKLQPKADAPKTEGAKLRQSGRSKKDHQ
ncbi:hypothetical protein PCASD_26508 [Puccinia coronata f. sp. avenae]|uniref:Uncharacterized protein n=1 Tax=Puccinia coronata f. sp. avenae TaxID=200324 RepID=A0A2N5TJM8_9BASI|nr:hypothetical protein PCASD_26508 [Puccinia coronata f. sp. avenae]